MALTDTFIKQVKHSGRASGDKHSDGKGLYLHVSATCKYWRMAYRFAGKQKTLTIGVYPATSLSEAREARDKARKHLAMDKDPSDAKREDKARQSAVAANDTLEATSYEWLELRKPTWSDSHYIRERRNVTKDLLPWLGARSIGTIKPIELLTVIRKVEERGSLDVAHRVHQTAHGIWCYAVATARAERDITPDIQKALKPHIKQNYPAVEVIEANMAHVSHVTHGGAYDRATHLQDAFRHVAGMGRLSGQTSCWCRGDPVDQSRIKANVMRLPGRGCNF